MIPQKNTILLLSVTRDIVLSSWQGRKEERNEDGGREGRRKGGRKKYFLLSQDIPRCAVVVVVVVVVMVQGICGGGDERGWRMPGIFAEVVCLMVRDAGKVMRQWWC